MIDIRYWLYLYSIPLNEVKTLSNEPNFSFGGKK